MATNPQLIPLDLVKRMAKRLSTVWPKLTEQPKPRLSICQEALAQSLGHRNWHDFVQSYGAKPEQDLGAPDADRIRLNSDRIGKISNDLVELMGMISISNESHDPQDFLNQFLSNWILAAKSDQLCQLQIICRGPHSAQLLVGRGDGRLDLWHELTQSMTKSFLSRFFNYLCFDEVSGRLDCDEVYQSTRFQSASKHINDCYVLFESTPLADGCIVNMTLTVPDKARRETALNLHQTLGFHVLSSPHLNTKVNSLSQLVDECAKSQRRVVVVSQAPKPYAHLGDQAHIIPVIYRMDDRENEHRQSAQQSLRAAMKLNPDVLIVDLSPSDWAAVTKIEHKVSTVVLMSDCGDVSDALIDLNRQGVLKDLVDHNRLKSVVVGQGPRDPLARWTMTPAWRTRLQSGPPEPWTMTDDE